MKPPRLITGSAVVVRQYWYLLVVVTRVEEGLRVVFLCNSVNHTFYFISERK